MTANPQRYQRAPRTVFRALHGRGWVGAPGHETVGIEGSALFVWLVLDAPASPEKLTDQIRSVWPELGEIEVSEVQAAIEALVKAGLVEGVSSAVDTAGVA